MAISKIPRKKKELELRQYIINFATEDGSNWSYFFFLRNVFLFLGSNYYNLIIEFCYLEDSRLIYFCDNHIIFELQINR